MSKVGKVSPEKKFKRHLKIQISEAKKKDNKWLADELESLMKVYMTTFKTRFIILENAAYTRRLTRKLEKQSKVQAK